jgi:hypothetical protein
MCASRESKALRPSGPTFFSLGFIVDRFAGDREAIEMNRQPRYPQCVKELVLYLADKLYLAPNAKCSLRMLAWHASVLAAEHSLIDAGRSISPKYVRRVIAEELTNSGNARIDALAGIRHPANRKRK